MDNNLNTRSQFSTQSKTSILATHTVLRNTYWLLGITLLFSALTAASAMQLGIRPISGFTGIILHFAIAYGLLFMTSRFRNSGWGLLCVFAFTGYMGWFLGPMLNMVLQLSNGSEIIMTALGGTGLIFFGLSSYVLMTKKDFSFMSGFIVAGMMVMFVCMIAGIFLQSSTLQLAISGGFMLLSSATILWYTSAIIHGGERNYIMATIMLYLQIYNLFISLLNILSILNGRD